MPETTEDQTAPLPDQRVVDALDWPHTATCELEGAVRTLAPYPDSGELQCCQAALRRAHSKIKEVIDLSAVCQEANAPANPQPPKSMAEKTEYETTESKAVVQQDRALSAAESALLKIAAGMLRPGVFLSEFAEDHPKSTPKWVIRTAEKQRAQLGKWAEQITATARSLRNAG